MKIKQRLKSLLILFLVVLPILLTGCDLFEAQSRTTKNTKNNSIENRTTKATKAPSTKKGQEKNQTENQANVSEDGKYSDKDRVAAYLKAYKKLPSNYLTKKEAMKKGWVASKGNLWKVTDEMSIGGDRFGNYEKKLPEKKGRQYFEADIDYRGGSRNAKRLIYSNDGLIFYTQDHYKTFEQLN